MQIGHDHADGSLALALWVRVSLPNQIISSQMLYAPVYSKF